VNERQQIPLAKPDIDEADVAAVQAVLTDPNGRLALGPNLTAFEDALAAAAGCRYAVAVNSGTSALHLIVRSLGLGPGDEVITTPFSFVASTNCILMEGATPVYVDIEPRTLCIDPEQIEAAITPRTKAILGVDVFGHPADWPRIEAMAEKHGLIVIEDSAEALGSRLNDKPCGGFGVAGVFAFYPNKQITTGEGGVVVTDDVALAELCRSMADQGRGDGGWLSHVRLGFNYRLDEMSAALGLSQMTRLDELIAARAQVAQGYLEALAGLDEIVLPVVSDDAFMSWFVFVVRLSDSFSREDRDGILDRLRAQGIGCRNYFQPLHLQPFLREGLELCPGQFPVTEAVSDRTIALPFFPQMTQDQVRRVAEALKREMKRTGRE
jgi:perosamine synthetase